jgi:hypothetical protein
MPSSTSPERNKAILTWIIKNIILIIHTPPAGFIFSINTINKIPGYNIYRVDWENKTGGGVCIYVRQIYKTICLRDISSISASGFHQLWLKVQVRHLKSIIICTVYRPPNTPTSCFDSDLAANFVYGSSLDAPIYILGDLNCNLLKPEASDCKVLGNFCLSYNLTQLIKEPTRVTEQTSLLLDIILVSDIKQVREPLSCTARSVTMTWFI